MMYIEGMMGLGDNVYQRAFISAIKFPVYIETPWPELYEGTLARPVLPLTHLVSGLKPALSLTPWAFFCAIITSQHLLRRRISFTGCNDE